jgi:5-formyltetrahydrofolate cyclo-ligase
MERLSSSQKGLFLENFPLIPPHIVAGYWPLQDECDARPLLESIHHQGVQVCLPRVEDTALVFYLWHPQDALVQSQKGVWEPVSNQAVCTPTHILVPLLAFDRQGYRLGYGGGFYDRALAKLYQENPSLMTIGYAFECQYVDFLPHDRQDWALDYVMTPEKVYVFKT